MGYKLIALDIDGTISSNEYPLTERTRKAISGVMESGAVVTLATGRMFRSALAFTSELNITSPIVSFLGAHVADPTTGEVLWHRPLTSAMGSTALEALDTWEGVILAYHDDKVFANMVTPWVEGYAQRNPGQVHVATDLKALAAGELTRLVAVGSEEDIYRLDLRLKATIDSQMHITRSLPYLCEILHPESGKHKALAWLCRHLGVARDQTVGFGNGYEDVHMLRWVGLGVAVGGAVPEVLEVADQVAPPMEEDGAARVLEDLLERGLVG